MVIAARLAAVLTTAASGAVSGERAVSISCALAVWAGQPKTLDQCLVERDLKRSWDRRPMRHHILVTEDEVLPVEALVVDEGS